MGGSSVTCGSRRTARPQPRHPGTQLRRSASDLRYLRTLRRGRRRKKAPQKRPLGRPPRRAGALIGRHKGSFIDPWPVRGPGRPATVESIPPPPNAELRTSSLLAAGVFCCGAVCPAPPSAGPPSCRGRPQNRSARHEAPCPCLHRIDGRLTQPLGRSPAAAFSFPHPPDVYSARRSVHLATALLGKSISN